MDAWGVDFALLDGQGKMIGNPVHYRDARTNGMPELVFSHVSPRELYNETAVQTLQINTLFQLYSMVQSGSPQLAQAKTLLMIPDLFHYFLCGEKVVEYYRSDHLADVFPGSRGLGSRAARPARYPGQASCPRIVNPGTVLGQVLPQVWRRCGILRPPSRSLQEPRTTPPAP